MPKIKDSTVYLMAMDLHEGGDGGPGGREDEVLHEVLPQRVRRDYVCLCVCVCVCVCLHVSVARHASAA